MLYVGNSGRLEDVESVPGFVQCCHYVIVNADGVDEDKWFADGCVGGAIRPGCLIPAVRQVGETFRHKGIEIAAQHRVHLVEDGRDALLEFVDGRERLERWRTGGRRGAAVPAIHQVPGTQRIDAEAFLSFFVDARRRWHNHLLDGVREGFAVFRGVIETQFLFPGVLTVGWHAGIFGNPGTHIHEFHPQFVNGRDIRQLACCLKLPGLFPALPVGLLEIHNQAGQGNFLALPIDRLGAVDLVVLDGQFLLLGQQGQIGRAEQVRFGAHIAQRDLETFGLDLAG